MEGSPGPRGRGRDGAKRRAARSARFAGDRPTQREEEKGALCGQRLSLLPRPRVSQCLNTLNSSKNGGASRTGGPARRMTRFRRSPGVEQKKTPSRPRVSQVSTPSTLRSAEAPPGREDPPAERRSSDDVRVLNQKIEPRPRLSFFGGDESRNVSTPSTLRSAEAPI